MEQVLPLLLFTAPARHQAEFTKRLLLAAVPGQLGLAFTAVVARQQISSREQAELRMVQEAAARFTNPEDLETNAPTLHGIYAGLPESVRETIKFKTGSPGQKPDGSQRPREGLAAALKEQETKEKQTLGRKA
jgi:hypothetical protein